MQAKGIKKLLLPLDGSKRSIETVHRLSAMKPFRSYRVVLLHVFNSVPECYWDISREPKSIKTAVHVKAWEREQRKAMEALMRKARNVLIQTGFDEAAVDIKIQNRKQGIARDIVKEAQNDYAGVMIRRRGAGAIRSMVLGSVATKLIASITFTPLLILGRQKPTGKLLVAMDSSDGAMHALDFVAANLGGYDYDVHLLHVMRGDGDIRNDHPELASIPECRSYTLETMQNVFKEARRRLVAQGFSENQLSEKIQTGVFSRAAAIVKIAKEGGFETIVVGRQGVSHPRSFVIGRVSNKAIHMGRQLSVWIIN